MNEELKSKFEEIIGAKNTDVEDTIIHTSTSEVMGWLNKAYNLKADEWVSIADRLPGDFKPSNGIVSTTSEYQIYDEVMGICKAWLKRWDRDNNDTLMPRKKGETLWEHTQYKYHHVTHWQPLPTPPNQ